MDPYIFGFFALAYIVILIWGIAKHKKTASAIIFFVILALIYDNAILAVGHLFGEGELLKNLSYGRFWLHAIFTPTLIIFSLLVMREANIEFAYKKWVAFSFGALWIVAMIVEYFMELSGLELAPKESYGVLNYSTTEAASGPPPMILIVLVALLIAAVTLAWKRKWWWMLVGTIFMTIGSAVPIDIGSDAITNAFELFLIATLMWTAIHFSNDRAYKRF
ncbi:phospholipid phosphatase [Solibacillus sp. FSL W8-0474]|uniref:phospholipid phosphatase n=1 Tax=Solibacillus sp. FSL W8-0474 TaxID=2975336 RepID=UPI0030FA6EA8